MIVNPQQFDYRNQTQGTPSPQPHIPFNISPQPPNISPLPQFTTSHFPATFPADTTFPLNQLPPFTNGNIITPVPMSVHMDISQPVIISHANNPFLPDNNSINIDPEDFQINSSEIRNILQDFSSGQQQSAQMTEVNLNDRDEQNLSDSFNKILNKISQ